MEVLGTAFGSFQRETFQNCPFYHSQKRVTMQRINGKSYDYEFREIVFHIVFKCFEMCGQLWCETSPDKGAFAG